MPSRLGTNPLPSSSTVTKVMRANKGKNTKPEITLRKALFAAGIRGYRLHWKKAVGHPDISFPGLKLAVFVFGCYWHRCQMCKLSIPKSNTDFWVRKFNLNKQRDHRTRVELEEAGWKVVEVWECEIKNSLDDCVWRVSDARNNKRYSIEG